MKIRAMRKIRGLTVGQLAHRAGLSRSFVTAVEAGSSSIALVRLRRVAYALGMTVSQLIEGTTENSGYRPGEEKP